MRNMGADKVINRSEMDFRFWNEDGTQQNPKEWQRSARPSASSPAARTSTSSSSTPVARRSAPRSTSPARAAPSPRARRRPVHARVRQPLPVDESQADHLLALRQLPRVVGGQPPHRPGQDPPDPVAHLHARGDRQAALDVHHNKHQARSACCAWPRRRAWACSTRSCATSTWTRSICSAGSDRTSCHRRGPLPRDFGERPSPFTDQ